MRRFIEIEVIVNNNRYEEQEPELPFRIVGTENKEEKAEDKNNKIEVKKILVDINAIDYIGETYKEETCTINGEYLVNESYESLKTRLLKIAEGK